MHPDGGLFLCIRDPLSCRLHCYGMENGGCWGSWGCTHASAVSGVVRFKSSTAEGRVGWSQRCLSGWSCGVPGPTAPAAQLTCGPRACCAKGLESCVPPLLLLLGSPGLRAWLLRWGPLCVPVHSPLDVLMHGILWCPGVLGRGIFCCIVDPLLVVD